MNNPETQTQNDTRIPMESVQTSTPPNPNGFTIEYVMLSVTVVSGEGSAGQFDDSIAHIISKHLPEYYGVIRVEPEVLYRHTKIERHFEWCECGVCKPQGMPSVEQEGSEVR